MQDQNSRRCPACGEEVPVHSRFCGQCGIPLVAPAEETPQPEGQPASEEPPIFLHTSSRSYQVQGESITPPKSSKTHALPLSWLEETLQSEPTMKLKASQTRPFPFPAEEPPPEQTPASGKDTPPPQPPAQPQSQTPLPPPLPRIAPTPTSAAPGEVPPWLVSVVASLEGQEEPPEGRKAWKKRTLLIVLGSVVLVVVAAVVVFLLSSHIL
ncbi:MAG TPA: zinc ribbon domain-containing protein [Ktedonobacterales bacterium]